MSRRYKKYYENEYEEAQAQLRLASYILIDIKRETGEIDDPNYRMLPSRFTGKSLAYHADPETNYPYGMARDMLERITIIQGTHYVSKTELLAARPALESWIEKQIERVKQLRIELTKIKA